MWESRGVIYVRGAQLNEERILADELRLGAAAAVVVFAPTRDSNSPHHQKFRASCEETPSPREQADLYAVADVLKACQKSGKAVILIRHERSFMRQGVFKHLCDTHKLRKIPHKPVIFGCPGESLSRLDSCHVAISIGNTNRERNYKEIRGEIQYDEIPMKMIGEAVDSSRSRLEVESADSLSHGRHGPLRRRRDQDYPKCREDGPGGRCK